jgi:hypothetical protein
VISYVRLIPDIIGIALSVVIFLATTTIKLPREDQLSNATGNLISVESIRTGKRSFVLFRVEGIDTQFSYSSMGRSCGYVYNKLLEKQGKSLSIKYDKTNLISTSNLPDFYRVYDMWSETHPICTYWDIREMYETEHKLGIIFGVVVISLSLFSIYKNISNPSFKRDA